MRTLNAARGPQGWKRAASLRAGTLWIAAFLAGCGSEGDGPAHAERASVVFVSVDTLSARHMSLYGYARETTPGLDALAASSVVFERAWANAPWTTPSYLSQFTGLFARSLRPDPEAESTGPEPARWGLPEGHPTLAEAFRRAGYRTAAFVDNWNAGPQWGLDRGFEFYDMAAADVGLEDPSGGIRHIVPRALAWLDGLDPEEPFFLFVQVLDVHGPYFTGRAAEKSGAAPFGAPCPVEDREVPVAVVEDHLLGAIPSYIAAPFRDEGSPALPVCSIVDAYDAGIRATDEALRGFVDALDRRGILKASALVISADHGESMVEHDSYFDHKLLHAEELHVPLIVRVPGGSAARRVAADVQLVDLFPTLADLAGLAMPKGHGRSLRPALLGEALEAVPIVAHGDFYESRSLLFEGWKLVETSPSPENAGIAGYLTSPEARALICEQYPEFCGKVFGTPAMPPDLLGEVDLKALDERSRSHMRGPFRRLFRIGDDPDERVDLAAGSGARLRTLLETLDAIEARGKVDLVRAPPAALDEGVLRELEKLGYGGK